ncbi:UNVERIFIED_CONTAM: hypothetical protein M9606_23225, partial [Salmonella sp. NW993]
ARGCLRSSGLFFPKSSHFPPKNPLRGGFFSFKAKSFKSFFQARKASRAFFILKSSALAPLKYPIMVF